MEEEEEVETEVAEVAEEEEEEEEEVAVEEEEEEEVVIVIIKTPVAISVKTWIISSFRTLDMGIENVIQIIEIQEDIKEVVVVEEVEVIEKILVQITVKIIIKVIVKTMTTNNHNILVKEIFMGMITEVVETIIKTGEKVEEGRGEEAEFKVDGIKVAILE